MLYSYSSYVWLAFFAIVLILLTLDLGILHSKKSNPNFRASLKYTILYFVAACIFGGWIWYEFGTVTAEQYFTAYFIEKVLALDNILVINLIFSLLSIPTKYQHRVLFWGIFGAIFFRGIFIIIGISLLAKFSWLLLVFAVIISATGIKILTTKSTTHSDIKDNLLLKFIQKYINITPELTDDRFIVRKDKIYATPLFVALILIESMDLIFAIDSLPAVFTITQDTYVIYTSNIFAILGLRSLYFCLANVIERFKYMKYSLGVLLIIIGAKIFIEHYGFHISSTVTLLITMVILSLGAFISYLGSGKHYITNP